MAQPYRHPQSGIYQLRRKVPEELRPALGHEYKRSLKTHDALEAKAKFAAEWSKSEQAFARARAQLAGVEVLSVLEMHQLAQDWYQRGEHDLNAGADPTQWLVGGPASSYDTPGDLVESVVLISLRNATDEDIGLDLDSLIADSVRAELKRAGIPTPTKAAEGQRLHAAFKARWLELSDLALRRYEGDWSTIKEERPSLPSMPRRQSVGARGGMSLPTLFKAYREERLLNDGDTRAVRRTLGAYEAVVLQFVELCGDLKIGEIDREVVRQYRLLLAQLPAKGCQRGMSAKAMIQEAQLRGLPLLSEPTIRNKIKAISAVLSLGVQLEHIAENPVLASGTARAASKAATRLRQSSRKRRDYSQEELGLIFNSPIFSGNGWTAPRADFGKAWYWLPLLLYYTGARREELAQLLVRDIVSSENDGPYLNILAADDEDDGSRGVKTQGSRRRVPLHPDLVSLGLFEYAAEVGGPDSPLFPRLVPNPAGYYGANFGKRWAEYLKREVGLRTTASPSHGFRHTFKTLCRGAGIAEDVIDAMAGHSSASIGRSYGEMPFHRMSAELNKFPSLPGLVRLLQLTNGPALR